MAHIFAQLCLLYCVATVVSGCAEQQWNLCAVICASIGRDLLIWEYAVIAVSEANDLNQQSYNIVSLISSPPCLDPVRHTVACRCSRRTGISFIDSRKGAFRNVSSS